MKILLLTQWFDPEPFFKGLSFAKELIKQGHEVEVLTGFPNYPGGKVYDGYKIKIYHKELMDNVVVHRVALYPDHGKSAIKRVINYVSFGFFSCLFGIFKLSRFDVIYAYHPPLTTGIAASLISLFRRTPVVLDVQDLWPDTLAATGMLSDKKALSIVGWVCKQVYKSIAHIVVLSPGFERLLIQRGVPANKLSVIYNWCDEAALEIVEESPYRLPEQGFNLVFAGNLGFAQGLQALVETAKILSDKNIRANIVFVGDGVAKNDAQKLTEHYQLKNVFFIPRVTVKQVGSLLNVADALLVHLVDDELFKITIPSRTQAYLFTGKPILMAVSGDAAQLIQQANAGIIANPNCPKSLADAIKNLVEISIEEREQLATNAQIFYKENLSMAVGVKQFIEIFEKVKK